MSVIKTCNIIYYMSVINNIALLIFPARTKESGKWKTGQKSQSENHRYWILRWKSEWPSGLLSASVMVWGCIRLLILLFPCKSLWKTVSAKSINVSRDFKPTNAPIHMTSFSGIALDILAMHCIYNLLLQSQQHGFIVEVIRHSVDLPAVQTFNHLKTFGVSWKRYDEGGPGLLSSQNLILVSSKAPYTGQCYTYYLIPY